MKQGVAAREQFPAHRAGINDPLNVKSVLRYIVLTWKNRRVHNITAKSSFTTQHTFQVVY